MSYRPMDVTRADLDGIEAMARSEVDDKNHKGRTYSVTPGDVLDLCAAVRERDRYRVAARQLRAALQGMVVQFGTGDDTCISANEDADQALDDTAWMDEAITRAERGEG